jgi:hydrogenase nickel incorporation protein HypA/HybF
MHELSLVMSIIEISEATAREHRAGSIRSIKLRLGEFTSVVREALVFSFEVARQGTLAAHATLEIEDVPLVTRCGSCGSTARPSGDICLLCPGCGVPLEVISGEELQVEYIELD